MNRRLVLIHGFTERPSMWNSLIDGMNDDTLAISTPSIPGHGNHPEIPENPTTQSYCNAIMAQIPNDDLPWIIVGHSMGGYLASSLVTMVPERIHSLGLFHSKAGADDDAKRDDRRRAIAAASKNKDLYLATMLRNTLADENVERLRDELNTMIENAQQDISSECIAAAQRVMIDRPDNISFLQQAAFAIHYLLGKQDKSIPFEIAQREVESLPKATVHVLEKTGHMGQIENLREAADWLRRLCAT